MHGASRLAGSPAPFPALGQSVTTGRIETPMSLDTSATGAHTTDEGTTRHGHEIHVPRRITAEAQ